MSFQATVCERLPAKKRNKIEKTTVIGGKIIAYVYPKYTGWQDQLRMFLFYNKCGINYFYTNRTTNIYFFFFIKIEIQIYRKRMYKKDIIQKGSTL